MGLSYDAAGNVLADGSGNTSCSGQTYTWNAEERITCALGTNYTYDGDGVRVEKTGGSATPTLYFGSNVETGLSGNETSIYVFFNGRRVARRDPPSGNVYYSFHDMLESSNVVATSAGGVENESDFYPYGGENPITDNLTNQHYKFTGKERDAESGNDYFGARYYASAMGRFMSPDPLPWIHLQHGNESEQEKFGAFLANPQNFNMYAYVNNNPLNKTDPTGMNACGTNDDSSCHVTITFADRSRDANGNYNDSYAKQGLAHQEDYNATATVTVTGTGADGKAFSASGTFLARTLSDDGSQHATIANGTYDATSFTKTSGSGNYKAILLTGGIPTATPNPSRADGQSIAYSIEVHKAGLGGVAVASDPNHPISAGCQTIYRDQFSDFQRATGLVPSAGSVQGAFTVNVSTGENTVYNPN